jgi:hypothetical protein
MGPPPLAVPEATPAHGDRVNFSQSQRNQTPATKQSQIALSETSSGFFGFLNSPEAGRGSHLLPRIPERVSFQLLFEIGGLR